MTVERKTVASLKQDLDTRISELEQLRKVANRDRPLSPAVQRDSIVSTASRSRHEHPGEEIAGLKYVIVHVFSIEEELLVEFNADISSKNSIKRTWSSLLGSNSSNLTKSYYKKSATNCARPCGCLRVTLMMN